MAIQTRLEDMAIGDKIIAKYVASSGVVGTFSELGSSTAPLIPAASSATPNGSFYWIKAAVDYKGRSILVADRNVAHSISWDKINESGVGTHGGIEITSLGLDPTQWKTNIRLLTGGTSQATKNNSEWSKYIVNGVDAGANDTWNWDGIFSWTSTTIGGSAGSRALAGHGPSDAHSQAASSYVKNNTGFRPVLVAEPLGEPIPPTSFLLQENGEVKTYDDGWMPVADASEETFLSQGIRDLSVIPAAAWNALGDTFEVLQYVSDAEHSKLTFETETYTPLDQLGETPKVLLYSNEGNKSAASATLEALPTGQLVFQEEDIDLSNVEGMQVKVSGNIKLLLSNDSGVTWKGKTLVDPADLESVKTNGFTPEEFNALSKEEFQELFPQGKARLAYYLEQDSFTDTVLVDNLSVTAKPVATETPTLDSVKITYDDLTIEGRLQDVEKINAINMMKLQFKTNALMQSEKYKLHDLVVDIFEDDSMITTESSNTNKHQKEMDVSRQTRNGYIHRVHIDKPAEIVSIQD